MNSSYKLAGAVVGAGAVIALGTLAIGLDGGGSPTANLAGSGDAPTNTIYVQPNLKGMNVGATVLMTTTPPSAPPTAIAKPGA